MHRIEKETIKAIINAALYSLKLHFFVILKFLQYIVKSHYKF